MAEITKQCTQCKEELPLSSYSKQKAGRFGRRAACRSCTSKKNKEYNKLPHVKKKMRANSKKYQKNIRSDPERLAAYKKRDAEASSRYYEQNKPAVRAKQKKYQEANREALATYCRDWSATLKGKAKRICGLARARARNANREHAITWEWVYEKLVAGVCERTGIPFVIGARGLHAFAPSIDRIDSSKGYTPDNTQLVVYIYNTAKSVFDDDTVLEMALSLVEHSSVKRDRDRGAGRRQLHMASSAWATNSVCSLPRI
jgi:cation transport ATPase